MIDKKKKEINTIKKYQKISFEKDKKKKKKINNKKISLKKHEWVEATKKVYECKTVN